MWHNLSPPLAMFASVLTDLGQSPKSVSFGVDMRADRFFEGEICNGGSESLFSGWCRLY